MISMTSAASCNPYGRAFNRARVIIAEMTERNPNVFYELGIAHTIRQTGHHDHTVHGFRAV